MSKEKITRIHLTDDERDAVVQRLKGKLSAEAASNLTDKELKELVIEVENETEQELKDELLLLQIDTLKANHRTFWVVLIFTAIVTISSVFQGIAAWRSIYVKSESQKATTAQECQEPKPLPQIPTEQLTVPNQKSSPHPTK